MTIATQRGWATNRKTTPRSLRPWCRAHSLRSADAQSRAPERFKLVLYELGNTGSCSGFHCENFARLVDYEDRYAPGMRRFDTSLRANPMLINMLEAACKLLIEWQPTRVREYLLKIERKPVDRMRTLGFEVADESVRAANLFGVKLPAELVPEVCRSQLGQRKIYVSVRGSAVRASPHVYNDEGDLELLADALARL